MSDLLKKMSDSLIRSFIMSNLSELLTVAHEVIWANCWQLLIWSEQMSDDQMSEFPTL